MYEIVRLIILIAFAIIYFTLIRKRKKRKVIILIAIPLLIAILVLPVESYLFSFSLEDSFNYSFGYSSRIRDLVECDNNGLVFYTDKDGLTYRVYHKNRIGWNVISPNFDFLVGNTNMMYKDFDISKQDAGNHKALIIVSEYVSNGQSKVIHSVLNRNKSPFRLCEVQVPNHTAYYYYEFQNIDQADYEVIVNDEVYKIR